MQDAENQAGQLPDRAEEHRVGTPQNETQAPVESAQADAAPTQETTAENSGAQAAPTTTEVTETQTVRETSAGTSDNS